MTIVKLHVCSPFLTPCQTFVSLYEIVTNVPLQQFKGRVSGVKVKSVDTTGAGDAFVGGILYCLASDVTLFQVTISATPYFLTVSMHMQCVLLHCIYLCIIHLLYITARILPELP